MTDPGQQDAPDTSHGATGTGAGLPDWRHHGSTVDPADMWAYATRPIGEADPDAPLLAVLAAADAAEPHVRRVGNGAMVDARYEVPCPSSDTADGAVSQNGPMTDTLARAADEHRRIGQRMWDAVTRGMRAPDTQRDYLEVQ